MAPSAVIQPAAYPDLPDAAGAWAAQHKLALALGASGIVTELAVLILYGSILSLLVVVGAPGWLGLAMAATYFARRTGERIDFVQRAKVARALGITMACVGGLLAGFFGLLTLALCFVRDLDEEEEEMWREGWWQLILLMAGHTLWYSLLTGLGGTAAQRFGRVIALANPVSSGIAQL